MGREATSASALNMTRLSRSQRGKKKPLSWRDRAMVWGGGYWFLFSFVVFCFSGI